MIRTTNEFCLCRSRNVGANTSFDCVLEACFILTNDKLQELDRIHVKNRLEEGIVPNLGALQVTGIDVNWLKQNPSPYQSNEILEKNLKVGVQQFF